MRQRQKVSRAGIELIKSFEGLRRKSARLPDGRWVIGYGHTLSAREGAEVDESDAEALLLFDLMPVVEAVNNLVTAEIGQGQFDALAAFTYNVGVDAFRGSEVLRRVNDGRFTDAACAIDLWRKAELPGADPRVLDALIRRRAAEKAMFLKDAAGFMVTPSALLRPQAEEPSAPLMPAGTLEIDVALEGDAAEVRAVNLPEPPQAVAAEPVAEPAEEPTPEPEAESAPEPEPEPEPAFQPEPEVGSVSEAAPEAESQPATDAEPAQVLSVAPEVSDRTLPESAPSARIFSAYGPMAGAALGPLRAAAAATSAATPASEDRPAAEEASPSPADAPVESVTTFGPPVVAETAVMAEIAGETTMTTEADAPVSPLVLTPPPEDWEPPAPAPREPAPPGARAEDRSPDPTPPLFDDSWSLGAAASNRIIRHEEPVDLTETTRSPTGLFALLGLTGLAAFFGAVAAFLKGRGTESDMAIIAWVLALIGVGCVSTAVYFLLKRLGGAED